MLDGRQDVSEIIESKQNLSWGDAWKIAGKIAFEIQFRSAMSMSQGGMDQLVEKQIEKARANTKRNKGFVSFFIAMLAGVFGLIIWSTLNGLLGTLVENRWITIAFTVSVFNLIGLGFLVFWGLMISTSFISTNAASIGHYLPLSHSDTGKLALLAYIRLFDAQMFTIIIGFPLAYGLATMSIIGALACFVSFLITVGLAITLMLILALYFYTRIQTTGGSRLGSIIRIIFIFLWVVAFMGLSLSFQILPFIIPLVETFAVLLLPVWFIITFSYPFSLGTFVVLISGVHGTPAFWPDMIAVIIYGFLAFVGVRWSRRFLMRIGTGSIIQSGPSVVRPVKVKVSSISIALLRKDLRIALRTPGQAIMFFLPILVMVPIFLQFFWDAGYVFVSDVLIYVVIPTMMLGFTSIFFLSLEARGMVYTLTLPIKTERILRSKAQLLTCISVVIPIFVIAVSFFKPFTNPISFAIAFSQIPVVYVSAMISLVLFTRIIGGGRLIGFEIGQHITQMIFVSFISAIIAFLPIGFFGIFWIIGSIITGIVEIAHLIGFAGLWLGILLNYLIGKILARYSLIDG